MQLFTNISYFSKSPGFSKKKMRHTATSDANKILQETNGDKWEYGKTPGTERVEYLMELLPI